MRTQNENPDDGPEDEVDEVKNHTESGSSNSNEDGAGEGDEDEGDEDELDD